MKWLQAPNRFSGFPARSKPPSRCGVLLGIVAVAPFHPSLNRSATVLTASRSTSTLLRLGCDTAALQREIPFGRILPPYRDG
jgi:hypothetical protein